MAMFFFSHFHTLTKLGRQHIHKCFVINSFRYFTYSIIKLLSGAIKAKITFTQFCPSTLVVQSYLAESHSSENSRTLIGYQGEVFSVELRLLKARLLYLCPFHFFFTVLILLNILYSYLLSGKIKKIQIQNTKILLKARLCVILHWSGATTKQQLKTMAVHDA